MIVSQWQCLSGRVLDLRLRGRWFEPHCRHFVVSLSKTFDPLLNLVWILHHVKFKATLLEQVRVSLDFTPSNFKPAFKTVGVSLDLTPLQLLKG